MSLAQDLYELKQKKQKLLAVLIDPEKTSGDSLISRLQAIDTLDHCWIFVGGSLVEPQKMVSCVNTIKMHSSKPCILFPGNPNQITYQADGLLYLSLLSGRNPDYLIGHHVQSALEIKKSKLEVIPTGYLLIDGGKVTSVQYVSNTFPIPSDKIDLAVSTAVAGELLGMKLIYMDAGSGALNPISGKMIQAVRNHINLPIIVGGGIRSVEQIEDAFESGADVVVVGTAIENNEYFIQTLKNTLAVC